MLPDGHATGTSADRPRLPPRLGLLCVGFPEGSWAGLALQLDLHGCGEPHLCRVPDAAAALETLAQSAFDCLLLRQQPGGTGHHPVALLDAIRAAGCEEPAIVVCERLEDDRLYVDLLRLRAEPFFSPHGLDSPALPALLSRVLRQAELVRENRQLSLAGQQRLSRDRDEAEQLLSQQRQMLLSLEAVIGAAGPAETSRPQPAPSAALVSAELEAYYQELLRTYVIMGSGSLRTEIARLAELLCASGSTPRQVLEFHLQRVEQAVRGLGNRSARHVLSRADLLGLELMTHVAERRAA